LTEIAAHDYQAALPGFDMMVVTFTKAMPGLSHVEPF
jgi:hypothetical protein